MTQSYETAYVDRNGTIACCVLTWKPEWHCYILVIIFCNAFYFLHTRLQVYSFETYIDHVRRSAEFQHINDNDLGYFIPVHKSRIIKQVDPVATNNYSWYISFLRFFFYRKSIFKITEIDFKNDILWCNSILCFSKWLFFIEIKL